MRLPIKQLHFFFCQGKQHIYPLTFILKKSKTLPQLKFPKNKPASPSRQEAPAVKKKKKKNLSKMLKVTNNRKLSYKESSKAR